MQKQIKNENGIELNLVSSILGTEIEFVKDNKIIATSPLQKANENLKNSQKWTNDYYLSGAGFFIPIRNETALFIQSEITKFEAEFMQSAEYQNELNEAEKMAIDSENQMKLEKEMSKAGHSTGYERVDKIHGFNENNF